jgi:hypothetical protein
LLPRYIFYSLDAVKAGLVAPQGQATAGDLANFTDGGAELYSSNERSLRRGTTDGQANLGGRWLEATAETLKTAATKSGLTQLF